MKGARALGALLQKYSSEEMQLYLQETLPPN